MGANWQSIEFFSVFLKRKNESIFLFMRRETMTWLWLLARVDSKL